MKDTPALEALKQALRRLPGVGPKSAQRMALHLLERDREGGEQIVSSLQHALKVIGHCSQCNNLTEQDVCAICGSPRRDHAVLCVVESPADLMSMEETGVYQGTYFVLMGHLSPLDGIGPEELGIDKLEKRLADGEVKEVILATNLTVEGDATAHYISDLVHQHGLKASRIAHGVPLGGELEYVDSGTLARALDGRREV